MGWLKRELSWHLIDPPLPLFTHLARIHLQLKLASCLFWRGPGIYFSSVSEESSYYIHGNYYFLEVLRGHQIILIQAVCITNMERKTFLIFFQIAYCKQQSTQKTCISMKSFSKYFFLIRSNFVVSTIIKRNIMNIFTGSQSWIRQHHCQTIQSTEKFISMNLSKILCVVTPVLYTVGF